VYKCLVTGGAGFIGSHLVEALVNQGHAVRVLDDLSTGNLQHLKPVQSRIELVTGSVTDTSIVHRAVEGLEVVFHLAALPSVAKSVEDPATTHAICASGTLHVLDAARRAGVRRVVYAASSSAYGDQPGERRTETDALLPSSPYAAAKLAGEMYCQAFTSVYGLETVRLRFFNVFGPRQDARSPYSGVIALFASAMIQRRSPLIYGDGLQTRDFVYVDNIVQALIGAAKAPEAAGRVFNIGSGVGTSILDLVEHLNRLLGTRLKADHQPQRAGDVRHSVADISQARRHLSYEPAVAFAEGLRRTLQAAAGK
jgi:UDP-glucose 4-epimerase